MTKLWNRLKNYVKEMVVLSRSVPPLVFAFFIISVIGMNLLANKSIDGLPSWFALDCGIIISWAAFMFMDVLTKRYGPRAATMVTIMAVFSNLIVALFFFLGSIIPGTWGNAFLADGTISGEINNALNSTFAGTWYVLLGSTTAFIVSGIVNNVLNWAIGLMFKKNPDGFIAFATRSYVSTSIGQFVDNLVFAFIVSMVFFGWSPVQCVTCAATGMVAELLFEVVFSPIGFRISKKMEKNNVGKDYFDYLEKQNHKEEVVAQ